MEFFKYLPRGVRSALEGYGGISLLREIRLRAGQPLAILAAEKHFLTPEGRETDFPQQAYWVSREDCVQFYRNITGCSVYALEEELAGCFITLEGGVRVGLAGRARMERGEMKLVRDCMQFAIRIPRQIKHCGEGVLPYLRKGREIHSTLIISPPGAGKTTLLRELARLLSAEGRNVCIVDERSELACLDRGISPFDLGYHTDILDHCPKREGMGKMLRVMAPEVLITDELGDEGDGDAVCEAVASGVTVLASIHGNELTRVGQKTAFHRLWQDRIFGRYVLLSARPRPGTVTGILDADGKAIGEGVA